MSAVCVQNGVPQQLSETTWFWHILTAKRWTCALSEHSFEEKSNLFDKPAPNLKQIALIGVKSSALITVLYVLH